MRTSDYSLNFPFANSKTLSAIAVTSLECVTIMTHLPSKCAKDFRISKISDSVFSSRFPVGSSAIIIVGSCANALAIAILMDNACKYTPNQGIISVSLKQSQNQVILEVTNTGSFIPEKDLYEFVNKITTFFTPPVVSLTLALL